MGDVDFFLPDDMKKVLFLTSHLKSGSDVLYHILDQNPRVQGFRSGFPYYDMPTILALTQQRHKLDNQAAIYMDELLYNFWLQTKDAYKHCKFIYVIRPPEQTLNELVRIYKPQAACNYYCYRLRRMCEMAKRTPGAVLLTWEDIETGRGLPLVERYLGLKQPLEMMPMKKGASTNLVPLELVRHADVAFNRYYHFLRSQPLVFYK
jgi:hypothetical protein